MSDDEDIRKALGKMPKEDYPRDLHTATRAEFVTRVRTNQKKPGCPLLGGIILSIIGLVVVLINYIF